MEKLQAPTADEIFKMWIFSLDKKTLEKFFKEGKIPVDRSRIPASENIKKVEKKALALLRIRLKIKYKEKEKIVTASKLVKIDFYDYECPEPVPVFRSLEKVTCTFCDGKGRVRCDVCKGKGSISCPRCKGTGYIKCDECNGTGKIRLTINIRLSETKITVKTIEVSCPKCGGTGKIICPKCYGTGRIRCENCDGKGSFVCKHCEGYGYLFKFKIAPIGKAEKLVNYVLPTKAFEEKIRRAIIKLHKNIDGVEIRSEASIDEDKLSEILGFKNDSINQLVKELKKVIKDAKSKGAKIDYPIIVYPAILVYVETRKGKKAQLLGVGTIHGFKVLRVK